MLFKRGVVTLLILGRGAEGQGKAHKIILGPFCRKYGEGRGYKPYFYYSLSQISGVQASPAHSKNTPLIFNTQQFKCSKEASKGLQSIAKMLNLQCSIFSQNIIFPNVHWHFNKISKTNL